jgi:hypothetical protein
MEACWTALEEGDFEASRALLKLSTCPKEAVAFLNNKMKPLKITPEQVIDLIGKLGSDKEEIWKPAFEELEYFDPRLAIGLEALMAKVTDSPARQRMVEVLSGRLAGSLAGKQIGLSPAGTGFNFRSEEGSWWAENDVSRINSTNWGNRRYKWIRSVRAIVLLEHIGSPDAIAILHSMATGHPEAQPTRAAKEAVKRTTGK